MKRLTIFAHYNSSGDVEEYIFYHLAHLRRHSQRLSFVSNSTIPETAQRRLSSICDEIRLRPNVGYDFSAWRDVILETNTEYDEILLTNSSIIGPLVTLDGVFEEMATRPCDFWGLTYGVEIRRHIQSFFVCFRGRLTSSAIWAAFWNSVSDESDKSSVIEKYETTFTHTFEQHGFSGDAYIRSIEKRGFARLVWHRVDTAFPVYTVRDANRVNPTIYMPLELIERGFPYIKAALICGEARRQGLPIKDIMRLENVNFDWGVLPSVRFCKGQT